MVELWDEQLADNLLEWVMYVFPWGKPGTPLERFKGPRNWQRDDLLELTDHIRLNKIRMRDGQNPRVFKKANAAGRGPGKSALLAWMALWNFTSHVGAATIVTANTEPQLKSRTFAELKKWMTLAINSHWYEPAALSLTAATWYKQAIERQLQVDTTYYYIQAQLWSEEAPDDFAGAHNQNGLMLLMDEGAGIANQIYNVSEGFFTDLILHRYWSVWSNPRRNSGAFHDIFNSPSVAPQWRHRHIDIRDVEGIDHEFAQSLIDQHGIDSDIVRIEVLGQFPKTGSKQFISNTLVYEAQARKVEEDFGAPLIMGVDPSRFGDDEFVIRWRYGRDARVIPPVRWTGKDNVAAAREVQYWIEQTNPDGVCIDSGAGSGVIDILRAKGYKIHEVHFGGKSTDPQWANKRTEMAAECREWLRTGAIDADRKLFTDLTAVDFDYYGKAKDQIILEPKEVVKGKTGRSPGDGDALWLTFAHKFARRDLRVAQRGRGATIAQGVDSDPWGE